MWGNVTLIDVNCYINWLHHVCLMKYQHTMVKCSPNTNSIKSIYGRDHSLMLLMFLAELWSCNFKFLAKCISYKTATWRVRSSWAWATISRWPRVEGSLLRNSSSAASSWTDIRGPLILDPSQVLWKCLKLKLILIEIWSSTQKPLEASSQTRLRTTYLATENNSYGAPPIVGWSLPN